MRSAGVQGPATGFGANLGIIDDPIKDALEASSAKIRENVWEWYQSTFRTRMQKGGKIVLIMTRWNKDDLAGRLLIDSGENWELLRLPAIADEEDDPIGREIGEALWPDQFDVAALEATKRAVGPYYWSAMYQQKPAPREGGIFPLDKIKVIENVPPSLTSWARYWDLAASTSETASYTASVATAVDPDGAAYYRDPIRGHWATPVSYEMVVETARREGPATTVVVEDKLWGTDLVNRLRFDKRMAGIAIQPQGVIGDKVLRAGAASALCYAEMFYIIQNDNQHDFIEELVNFPRGEHDDWVDSVSGGLTYVQAHPSGARMGYAL